jgi:hypothetical protein
MTDEESRAAVLRPDLPPAFERWQVAIEPGEERTTNAAEWSDAVVLVQLGVVEVHCRAGAWRTFRAGDILALSCLPVIAVRNAGEVPATLVAVRRSLR